MKILSDWWKARCAAEEAAAAARLERSKLAQDAITKMGKNAVDDAVENGWRRAVKGIHFTDDYLSCGCYLFSPDGGLYVMTVHSQGAIHFKRI